MICVLLANEKLTEIVFLQLLLPPIGKLIFWVGANTKTALADALVSFPPPA